MNPGNALVVEVSVLSFKTATDSEKVSTSARGGLMQHITLKEIQFLHKAHEGRCWYWEVVETIRRLLLTAVLSVVTVRAVCSTSTICDCFYSTKRVAVLHLLRVLHCLPDAVPVLLILFCSIHPARVLLFTRLCLSSFHLFLLLPHLLLALPVLYATNNTALTSPRLILSHLIPHRISHTIATQGHPLRSCGVYSSLWCTSSCTASSAHIKRMTMTFCRRWRSSKCSSPSSSPS
jgi:hypothetical protein